MFIRYLIFLFLSTIQLKIYSQKTLTTDLGNLVTINQDNKLSILNSDINPFESPEFNFLLDDQDRKKLEEIQAVYKDKDLTFFNKRMYINKEILLKKSMLENAQIQKNKVEIKKLNTEINDLAALEKDNEKKYLSLKNDYSQFLKIYNIKDKKSLVNFLNLELKKSSQGIKSKESKQNTPSTITEISKSKNDSKKTTGDQSIREQSPWEKEGYYTDNLFIMYTPENMKSYYKDEQLLKGYAKLVKIEKDYFVLMELRFNSTDITKSYGFIKTGDFLKLNMIYGQPIYLLAEENTTGKIESITGNTVYNAKFKVKNKGDLKRLVNGYVDSAGLLWSSGFEYYPVYKIDLLARQYKEISNKL